MVDAASEIQRLRRFRSRPEYDPSIAESVKRMSDEVTRSHRKLGQFVELWEELLPARLADRTIITGLRGGTAQVQVDSSTTAYEIDRLLREGLLCKLRSRYSGTLARVRLKQGASR